MVSVPEVEKPRVTEIQVRIDCNGCVQKIKKALYGINGIYDICVDLPQQKLTIIGWADPETLVRAIKKSRRTAAICPDPNHPPEAPPEGGSQPPPPETAKPSDPPPPEVSSPADPPPDNPQQQPKPENPQGEANPGGDNKGPGFIFTGPPKDGDVFIIGRPNHYGHRQPWFGNPSDLSAPFHVTHSYNTYKPFPYVTEYLEPPANYYSYGGAARWDHHYHHTHSFSRVSRNMASIFSDENPHACTIM
ncbi:hypothetical protein SAY86_011075 [Trapa natans]|uniref:HMA domain-containing protein n=1 Tax=Trapa natans TaxID=22666 RepID=A0AAN7LI92_TRANT|nr:hypothetical protein SAY86_011075 [Trapa natans]